MSAPVARSNISCKVLGYDVAVLKAIVIGCMHVEVSVIKIVQESFSHVAHAAFAVISLSIPFAVLLK